VSATIVLLARAGELPPDDEWLSAAERGTLRRFRRPERQRDFRVGRLAAKRALALLHGHELPSAARRFEVRPAPGGAPRAFADGIPLDVTLSIGHSDGRAAAAVRWGRAELGCDVERIEERSRAFVLDYFTAAEQAFVDGRCDGGRRATLVWSAKEAVMKALGEGLRLAPATVEVRPDVHFVSRDGWRRFELSAAAAPPALRGFWREVEDLVITVAADEEPRLVDSTAEWSRGRVRGRGAPGLGAGPP
jgi:4'-phosphopantetheinyl transferase